MVDKEKTARIGVDDVILCSVFSLSACLRQLREVSYESDGR